MTARNHKIGKGILIKQPSILHWRSLARLFARSFPYLSAADRSYCVREYGSTTWLAFNRGELAGFFTLLLNKSPGVCWIEYVAVDPRFRLSRVALALMDRMDEEAIRLGYNRLEGAVRRDNMKAISFYLKCGWYEVPKEGLHLTYAKDLKASSNPIRPAQSAFAASVLGRALRNIFYRLATVRTSDQKSDF